LSPDLSGEAHERGVIGHGGANDQPHLMRRQDWVLRRQPCVAVLAPIVGAPTASAAPNVGVSVNGVNAIQSGSAPASSERNGIAVAIGSNSTATALGGDNNLDLAFGPNNTATTQLDGGGNNNSAIVIGAGSTAIARTGNNNTAFVLGSNSCGETFQGSNNTATVIGSGSSATAGNGSNKTARVSGNNSIAIARNGGTTQYTLTVDGDNLKGQSLNVATGDVTCSTANPSANGCTPNPPV
jgi:hypothetical protein